MQVLILTKSDDNACVERVREAVERRGGTAVRFDTDRFPTENRLSMESGGGAAGRMRLVTGEGECDLGAIDAVWYRRTHPGHRLPGSMDAQVRRASRNEVRAMFYGTIACLPAFQLDPMDRVQQARHKLLQLEIAREVGLRTPRTLVSNDPRTVREFARACPGEGGIVTKMLTSFAIHEEGQEKVVFTTPLGPEHLEDLDGLRFCPMVFQERVPKAIELRVTVVGRHVFAASVDSQAKERSREDWRREGQALVEAWRRYDLPAAVRDGLLRLLDRLGLNYGAIDVIVRPDGEHVFIEVNPIGEFFWLEAHPGFPISDALAAVLLDPDERRIPRDR